MKILFLFFLLFAFSLYGQMYQRTGRNIGLTFGAQVSMIQGNSQPKGIGGSVGLIHMLKPGIFIKAGYSCTKNSLQDLRSSYFPKDIQQTIDGCILIDKRLLKLSHGRPIATAYGCHYFSIGIIAAPEYHFDLAWKTNNNSTPHEFSGLIGLSFCHIYKNKGRHTMSKTTQYDIFYRHGFTPCYTNSTAGIAFKRAEVGLQIRRIRHQVRSSIR